MLVNWARYKGKCQSAMDIDLTVKILTSTNQVTIEIALDKVYEIHQLN